MDIDINLFVEALQQQIADLSRRLAIAEACVKQLEQSAGAEDVDES